MIYLVCSDIHGNYQAVEGLMETLPFEYIDRKICLGDVVGYGADPERCIRWVEDTMDVVLLGNHDAGVVGKISRSLFRFLALKALEWTEEQISDDLRHTLNRWDYTKAENDLMFVHGTPNEPEHFHYELTQPVWHMFSSFTRRICFTGHTHIPRVISEDGKVDCGEQFFLDPDKRYIINVGSMGQPRDKNPQGCCVIYNDVSGELKYIRFPYDIATASKRIIEAGLPSNLAQRLFWGE